MNKMGVFLPQDRFDELQKALRPSVSMNLKTGITITNYGDKDAAKKIVEDFAIESGLPPLPCGHSYGVLSSREIITVANRESP